MMELTVITPKGILYNMQTDMVTFPGSQGSFTVLANHAPIVSTLKKGKILYNTKNSAVKKEIEIEGGLVNIKQNKIWVFTE